MGDEILHRQLIICVCFCPPLYSLLFKHLYVFSDDQAPRHPKLLGSLGQVLALDNLVEDDNKLEGGFWNSRPKQRNVDSHCIDVSLSRLGLGINLHRV